MRWLGFFAAGKADKMPQYAYMVYGVPIVASAVAIWFIVSNRDDGTAGRLGRLDDEFRQPRQRRLDGAQAALRQARHFRPGSRLMGWTLGRYFFFRYVTITIWFFLGLLALVFLIDFTELSGRTAGLPGFTYGTALAISALRVPMIMLQTVPFVGLFSAMATLVSLNRKYELVIARSAGISAWQFLLPCCIGALLFGLLSVGVLNPIAAHAFSRSEQIETQLRSGKSNAVSAFAAPWIRQKTSAGDTIIGARAMLNQGLEMADAVFFVLDPQGNIVERKDAARAYLRDGYWELQDVKVFEDGTIRVGNDRPGADQSQAGIRAGTAGAPGNHPVLRPSRQDRGCPLLRPQGKCFRHAVPFAGGAAVPARRHDADRGNGFDAICADGAVGNDDSGWRPRRLSALCRFGSGQGIRRWRDSCRPAVAAGFRLSWLCSLG